MSRMMFIDFEASSLSDESWPIEIGLAWFDENQKIRSAARLIRPDPSWDRDDWADKSAEIHKIPFSELKKAEPARDVARWAAQHIGFNRLFSDAPSFDGFWMRRLMDTISQGEDFEIFSLHEEAYEVFEGPAFSMFHKARANAHAPHRADADAAGLAQAWRAAVRKMK
jgi:DNA polymerase III subunit epsilon